MLLLTRMDQKDYLKMYKQAENCLDSVLFYLM